MYPYIGGKSNISKWIFKNIPQVKWDLYAEVFGGAMWLYLKRPIQAKKVIYNDYNPFLYNLWVCMTNHRDELIKNLSGFTMNDLDFYHENKKLFKEIENNKNEFLKSVPNMKIAARYSYQLTHCFSGDINGGMKRSQNGWKAFNKKLRDPYYIDKLNTIKAMNIDCIEFLKKYDGKNVFFYVDPPYYKKEHLYGFHNFDKQKHYDLADSLKHCKANWILSYYEYDDLKHLYPENEYIWIRKEYTRSSSAVPGKPGKGIEVLVFPKTQKPKKTINLFFK